MTDPTDKRQAWAVTIAAVLAGIAVTLNQFKVPPVMPALIADLHLNMATAGWLMSVFALGGVLLSIPAALLLIRVGPKLLGLISLVCVVIGSVLGALAPNTATLLISRIVEGISVGPVAVAVPALISSWFEPRDRGLPMGLWAAWVPIGNVVMFNIAQPLAVPYGWRSLWWFGALLALLVLALFALVVRTPPSNSPGLRVPESPRPRLSEPLLPSRWLLPLVFGTFTFSLLGYNTWAPAFLTAELHIEPAAANFFASLTFVAGMVANLTAGWAMNHTRHRYLLLTAAVVVSGVLFFWSFRLGSVAVVVPYMLALGFASNFIPTSTLTLAPETVSSPALIGLAMAMLNVVSNLGVLAGPPVIGAIVANGHWERGSLCMVGVMALGLIASLLAGRQEARGRR
jgi:predicted MFS family arabinose efflux permease